MKNEIPATPLQIALQNDETTLTHKKRELLIFKATLSVVVAIIIVLSLKPLWLGGS